MVIFTSLLFTLPNREVATSVTKSSDVVPKSANTRKVLGMTSFRSSSSSFLENLDES